MVDIEPILEYQKIINNIENIKKQKAEVYKELMKNLHDCHHPYFPFDAHGHAVEYCLESIEGELWVDNGEYSTRVNYCPFCGYKAKKQVELK
jgi:hypothetical protein